YSPSPISAGEQAAGLADYQFLAKAHGRYFLQSKARLENLPFRDRDAGRAMAQAILRSRFETQQSHRAFRCAHCTRLQSLFPSNTDDRDPADCCTCRTVWRSACPTTWLHAIGVLHETVPVILEKSCCSPMLLQRNR